MDQLEKEGVLSKTGKDTYIINRDKVYSSTDTTDLMYFDNQLNTKYQQTPGSEFTFVKDETDGQASPRDGKRIAPEDYMYMKVRDL